MAWPHLIVFWLHFSMSFSAIFVVLIILPLFMLFYYPDPGNDIRYVKYVSDMPISWFESIIRSLAHGQVRNVILILYFFGVLHL